MKLTEIDHGNSFDFGKTGANYAKYRDIYPKELYARLRKCGIAADGTRYLDIGTGTGIFPKNLYNRNATLYGIDISENQIAYAREEAKKRGMDITYAVSPAERTGLPSGSFDAITAAQCFWYFDREGIQAEIKRLLKPDGIFVKVYLTYLLEDEIAKKSHESILQMNPQWTPDASGSADMYRHPFPDGTLEIFDCRLSFTRESWHGRMCACRGTGASMDEKTYQAWQEVHRSLLGEYPEEFTIAHRVYVAFYHPNRSAE